MSRTRLFAAIAAAGMVAAATVTTGAHASASPYDKGILTNILMPLKGASAQGTTTIQIDPKARKVCYVVEQTGLSGALTAALMKGSTKILDLKNAKNGALEGCTDIDQDLAMQIVASPTDYSLSVNNGALQATLSPINNFS
jgi:hypothetical protein